MDKKEKNTIGTNIKKHREKLDMSSSRLADLAGTSQSAISFIENGERTPRRGTLEKIANALNVSVEELTGEDIDATYGNKGKFKSINFVTDDFKLSISIEIEPGEEVLAIEDEKRRKFKKTFHSRAVRTGVEKFLKDHIETIQEYINKSHKEELEFVKSLTEEKIELKLESDEDSGN